MSVPELPDNILTRLSGLLPEHKDDLVRILDLLAKKWNASPGKRGAHGIMKGSLKMKDNFDDPVPGFENLLP
jgi:hypothetical protein